MELRDEVNEYLRRTGMSATRFGRLVARDPSLVSDLRRGRRPLGRLRARILAQLGRPLNMAGDFAAALAQAAAPAGFSFVDRFEVLPWASLGFVGEQAICLLHADDGCDRTRLGDLCDHDWNLPFLVADLEICWIERGARITALVLPGS